MTVNANSIHVKPDGYTLHRKRTAIDAGVTLKAVFETSGNDRAAINCRGWDTVKVFVCIEGGTTPTVDIQPLEHVKGENAFPTYTDHNQGFTLLGSAQAGLTPDSVFSVPIYQGLLFLRITAITGTPTEVRVYVAGEQRANAPYDA